MQEYSWNKKGIVEVMTIILIIFAAIVVFGVTAKFVKLMGAQTQQSICSANIVAANNIIESDKLHWTLDAITDTAAATSLKHPLCTTLVNRVDLTDSKKEDIKKDAAIAMGEMIENCWSSFGEGKYVNTFGQGENTEMGGIFRDHHNYYFPCYKFKLISTELNNISVNELLMFSDKNNEGLLWKYNLKGKEIKGDISEAITKYLNDNNNDYLSYAGYIFYPGQGYLEFMNEVDDEVRIGDWVGAIATDVTVGAVGGAVAGLGGLSVPFAIIGGIAGLGVGIWGRITEGTSNMVASSGTPMTELKPNVWYEVRYYSPYIIDAEQYGDNLIINNIKIVPADEGNAGTEIQNIGLN